MPLFSRKDRTAEIAKAVAEELSKGAVGSLMGSPMYNVQGYANVVPAEPTSGGQGLAQQSGWEAIPLERPGTAFGSMLGPAAPLLPSPIDPVLETGRAEPRRYEYQVAYNLQLTQQDVPWSVLRALADQVDIISRAITIRTADIVKMDWAFTLSNDAIVEIMNDQNVSHAKAAKIGREKYGDKIAELTEFWENPYPEEYRGWSEWITEAMWNHLVFDGWVCYPKYNLGGKLMGFDLIDPSTIKILLDNTGRTPVPPAPAYQQILWGFPRGEFVASPMSDVDGEYYDSATNVQVKPTDSLAYFIRNRRTWSPYGFSCVEQAIPMATLYLERQNWMLAEYQSGSMPMTWMETDSDEIDHLKLAAFERVFNDKIQGNTQERHRVKVLPKGFKPVQSTTVDERYKSDYDEFITKKIAAIFGVAPNQLGVIARAGLGGGKGAQEGEEASSETVSSRPMENFIVEVINNLSRRFLGMDNAITFTLDNAESAQNEVEKAKAAQTALFSGFKTLNDVRGELGDPLFDMPEADEPFIVAGNAIQFLKGQLEVDSTGETVGQKENPLDETTPHEDGQAQSPQGQENHAQEGQAGSETPPPSVEEKTAEAKAFKRFMSKPRSREFQFVYHTDEEAELLKAQITDTPKGLVTKRGVEQTPGYDTKKQLENKHRHAIQLAIATGVTGIAAAIAQALKQEATDPNHIQSIVNLAVMQNVTADHKPLASALENLYNDTNDKAAEEVAGQLRIPLVKQGDQLQQLLAGLDQQAQGIQGTTLSRIRTAIVDGMTNGNSSKEIGTAINGIINDPARADMIATTEVNTSYNASAFDTFVSADLPGWNWIAYDGACEVCLSQEGYHDITDTEFPADASHPNCRCGIEGALDQPS